MADPVADADFLLALLNSTPVVDGVPTDDLAEPGRARAWLAAWAAPGTEAELRQMRKVRAGLQAVVRGTEPPDVLAPVLHGAACVPALAGGQISWRLKVAPERDLAVRAVLAWDVLAKTSPGGCARAPTTNAACSSSTTARRAAPGGARWPCAATG